MMPKHASSSARPPTAPRHHSICDHQLEHHGFHTQLHTQHRQLIRQPCLATRSSVAALAEEGRCRSSFTDIWSSLSTSESDVVLLGYAHPKDVPLLPRPTAAMLELGLEVVIRK